MPKDRKPAQTNRPRGVRIRIRRARAHRGRVSGWAVLCDEHGQILAADERGNARKLSKRQAWQLAEVHGGTDHKGFAHIAAPS